jgi:hypothetical protein
MPLTRRYILAWLSCVTEMLIPYRSLSKVVLIRNARVPRYASMYYYYYYYYYYYHYYLNIRLSQILQRCFMSRLDQSISSGLRREFAVYILKFGGAAMASYSYDGSPFDSHSSVIENMVDIRLMLPRRLSSLRRFESLK